MKLPSARAINSIGLLICLALLALSYYFQLDKGMDPCLLCLLQRWLLVLSGVLFFIAVLHHPQKQGFRIYGLLSLAAAIGGMVASGRQVWLQHQPPSLSEACVPGLNYLLQTRTLPEVLKLMLHGGQDCAEIVWSFGLTMPEWTLLFFAVLAFLALVQISRPAA